MSLSEWFRRIAKRTPRTLNSLDAYALWAANYPPQAHNALMEAEQQAMLDLMPTLAGQAVLDLACGTGRYGWLAKEHGAARVVEIDNSRDMLVANGLRDRAQATSEAIPLSSGSIEVVLCGLALGHLPRLQQSMDEIARVLKPSGTALVSDVHPFVALNGGARTFRGSDGKAYAVEHYPHLYGDYQRTAAQAGLAIDMVLEPTMDSTAGAPTTAPVAIVFRFYKRGRAIST